MIGQSEPSGAHIQKSFIIGLQPLFSRLALARKYICLLPKSWRGPQSFFWFRNIKSKIVLLYFQKLQSPTIAPFETKQLPTYPSPFETKRGMYLFRFGQLHNDISATGDSKCLCNLFRKLQLISDLLAIGQSHGLVTTSSEAASACSLIPDQRTTALWPRCQSGSCLTICHCR